MEQADDRDNKRLERTRNEKQYVILLVPWHTRILTHCSGNSKRRS